MTQELKELIEREAMEKYPMPDINPFNNPNIEVIINTQRRAYVAGKLSALEKVGEAWDAAEEAMLCNSKAVFLNGVWMVDWNEESTEAAKTAFIENLLK